MSSLKPVSMRLERLLRLENILLSLEVVELESRKTRI